MSQVLWLSNETPDPRGQGGQRRQYFQIREVVRAGHEVTVCTLQGDQDDTALRDVAHVVRTRTHWKGKVPLPAHGRLLSSLAERGWGAIVVAHTESWNAFSGLVEQTDVPAWVDLHNVLGQGPSGERSRWLAVEKDIRAHADVVSVCSVREHSRLLQQQPGGDSALVVMNHGIDPCEWRAARSPAETPVVKLFGNWGWGPNARGLEWFLTEVWPNLAGVGARCEIAGSGAVIPSLSEGTAIFVGRVPTISAWTCDAWAVAVPVMGGVGAPVKYLEALATGAPVLATPDGAPTSPQSAALVSADPAEWLAALGPLLSGAPVESGVELDGFSWAHATQPLVRWLDGFDASGVR